MTSRLSPRGAAAAAILLSVLPGMLASPAQAGGPGGTCPWNLDGAGAVGFADLSIMLAAWGTTGTGGEDLTGDRLVGFADLSELLAHWGPCPAPRFFGRYAGTATVTRSQYFAAGVYAAEVAMAQTPSGVVGYINIVFDPGDVLGGTVTHAFSGRPGEGDDLVLSYSDRICGAGDPIDLCYPHASAGYTQYSFRGQAEVQGAELSLAEPLVMAGLPYPATVPFDAASLTRTPSPPRSTFEGTYANLEYIWMGTALFPLPLPLFGNNEVVIAGGDIVEWLTNGLDIAIAGMDPFPVISAWCFDEEAGRGWMNQQGEWTYDWILDPGGEGLAVIVSFATAAPDCEALDDPLAGAGLDSVHLNLAGMMFELP